MVKWSLTEQDRLQAQSLGITEAQIFSQIHLFEKSSCFIRLQRPCTVGDGIQLIPEDAMEPLRRIQAEAASKGRCMKFVPASGAASRMFQGLSYYLHQQAIEAFAEIRRQATAGDARAAAVIQFFDEIQEFAFWDELQTSMASAGILTDANRDPARHWRAVLDCLLTERGLHYEGLPKGMIKFHRYPEGGRTAFEEHLVEAVHYLRDARDMCRLHFTISPEHREGFEALFASLRKTYQERYRIDLEVGFSEQARSTDTIAVDPDNCPFRDRKGLLVFRPGGHGALLDNLNDRYADLIYIKNIDNVVSDHLKEPTIVWKQVLGGYLVTVQDKVHGFVQSLSEGIAADQVLAEAAGYVEHELGLPLPGEFRVWSSLQRQEYLLGCLNRPVRVCGMVRNVGEPGGGPFWVQDRDGTVSRQIVESAQVDLQSREQQAIWNAATHFNPVDLVCGVRDYRGNPFDLRRYVDPDAVFISHKSKDGRELKALELPGLWNGAMANWITLFVEVPRVTFNPVKTVNSLLASEHQ
jgi:hypothetical protein